MNKEEHLEYRTVIEYIKVTDRKIPDAVDAHNKMNKGGFLLLL